MTKQEWAIVDWMVVWTGEEPLYWERVLALGKRLNSDGCTGVPEFWHNACVEHDVHYRTGKWAVAQASITREVADYVFRKRIQQGSWFGVASPMSWVRWAAVRVFGEKAWQGGKSK